MTPLLKHQQESQAWLLTHQTGLLLDEQGLGKTRTLLDSATKLDDRVGGVLVACPASLRGTWRDQVKQWTGFRPFVLDKHSWPDETPAWPDNGCVWIISYEFMAKVVKEGWIKPIRRSVLIADEAHMLASPGVANRLNGNYTAKPSQRSESFRRLSASVIASGGSVWGATGTPVEKPEHLWGLCYAFNLHGSTLWTWQEFRKAWGGGFAPFGWVWRRKAMNPEYFANGLANASIRHLVKDCLDLPPLRYQYHPVEISAKLKREATHASQVIDTEQGVESLGAFRARMALEKVQAGGLELADSLVAGGEPVVAFSHHVDATLEVGNRLDWACVTGREGCFVNGRQVDGIDTAVAAFKAGLVGGIAMSIATGGLGLTIVNSGSRPVRHVVMVDRSWSFNANAQAVARVYRLGQKEPVLVHVILADHPIEASISRINSAKENTVESIVNVNSEGRQP